MIVYILQRLNPIALGFLFVLFLAWLYSIIRVLNALNETERSLKRWVRANSRPEPLRYENRKAWEGEA